MIEETPLHLFYNCIKIKLLWNQLKDFISKETLCFSSLALQSAILGHMDLSDYYLLINHTINLIYKLIIQSLNRGYLNIEHLKAIIDKTKRIEEKISKHELERRSKYLIKCHHFTDELV